MTEENSDKIITSEGMESESGKVIQNSGLPLEEASDKNIEQREMECHVIDENTDRLGDKTSDAVNEHLSKNGQIPDDMIGQTFPSIVTDLSGQFKRNPTAVIVGSDHKFTVRSRYRRASIGSCHDLCKFGHKHELKKVAKRPLLGTIRESRPLISETSGDNLAKSVPEKETKKKELFRRLSLPGSISKKGLSNHNDVANSPKKFTPIQSKIKRVQSEIKPSPVPSPTPGNSISRSKTEVPAVKKTSLVKSSKKVEEIKKKEECSSSESGKVKAKELMSNNPTMTLLEESPSVKATLYKNLKSFSRSRHQSNSEDAKINKSCDVPEKAVYMIEPNAKNTGKGLKFSLPNEESRSTQRESRVGKTKKSNGNKKGTQFGLPSYSSPSASKSVASAARRTSQPQIENQQRPDSINTKQIGTVTEEGGSKTNTSREKTILKQQRKAKKTGIIRAEDKDGSAWKVNFRKGTVVNLKVANNSSKKLRFKKGRILGEGQNANAEKSLKNTDEMTTELSDTKPEPEKVHLRRQEASGKKDSIDLNNVIEETASKLVKTRKSKVKALVGAFETVMSFRDREPLVEASAS